jgi:RNA polymerase sigma factor (sigma-70 family)
MRRTHRQVSPLAILATCGERPFFPKLRAHTLALDGPPDQVFQTLLAQIDRAVAWQVRRHPLPAADAEDFAQYVKVKFIEDDYAVLRKFQERSSLSTYVTSVVGNAFQDFRNSLWGKWRPSAEARRLGPTAILLERCMVRDGLPFEQACQQLSTNHGIQEDRPELERIAGQLPSRVRRRMEPEEALDSTPAPDTADAAVRDQERAAIGRRIWATLDEELSRLPAEDAAILALRFKSGRKVSEIAVILALPQKPLYRRIELLIERLRAALEGAGVSHELIGEFLDES